MIGDAGSPVVNCALCGKEMFSDPKNVTFVCLEEQHGVLAFFLGISATSRPGRRWRTGWCSGGTDTS